MRESLRAVFDVLWGVGELVAVLAAVAVAPVIIGFVFWLAWFIPVAALTTLGHVVGATLGSRHAVVRRGCWAGLLFGLGWALWVAYG